MSRKLMRSAAVIAAVMVVLPRPFAKPKLLSAAEAEAEDFYVD
jgi:hypothetical protein